MQISLYYITGLNQDIEELFSGLSLFQNRLSATDIKSLTTFIFFSARERAEFNKSCNLIGSWSGQNFLIRSATAGESVKLIYFLERISGFRSIYTSIDD